MKKINYLVAVVAVLSLTVACDQVSYKKTKSGLAYKVFPGSGKDSVIKLGQVVKFHYTVKYNDSVIERFNSYGKLPGYVKAQGFEKPTYDFMEVLTQLKKGDSVVTVQIADTLMKIQSPILPPNAKKGDRVTMTVKIIDVFATDSVAQADYGMEAEKDRPRQEAQMVEEQKQRKLKEEEEMEKSGEAAKGVAAMEAYLKGKNIDAQKTGKGTFVFIKDQGAGPACDSGKFVTVKYTGRTLDKDSVFESSVYPLHYGVNPVIAGWEEGLKLFHEGGKGTLYVPGFLAYGKRHPAFKPFEALIFDIEILNVSDTLEPVATQTIPKRRN
jgi:FKBP-type peptidyl-prolyl cis-trans isomerase